MDEDMTGTAPSPSKEVRVIMVHGTWARGLPFKRPYRPDAPRWFERGSTMQRQIEAQLIALGYDPIVEEPLLWNHGNSFFDRGEGAQQLAMRLKAMPRVACLVLAHSHAGNLVLRALEELSDEQVSRLHVITLATPFVEMYLPYLDLANYERLQCGALAALVGFGVGSAALFASVAEAPLYWPALLIAFVLLWFGLYVCIGIVPAEQRCLQHRQQPCLARNLVAAAAYDKFKNRPPHLLVLRGVEDEAALIISTAAALGRISQIARDALLAAWHHRFRAAIAAGLVLLASLFAFVGYAWMRGTQTAPDTDLVATVRLVGMVTSGVIVLLPLVMSATAVLFRALSGLAAGREMLLMPHLEVSVSTSPDFNADQAAAAGRIVQVVTVPRRGLQTKHIRHALYDDEHLVDRAVRPWLAQVFPFRSA